jgi:hypothetical protein
MTNRVDPVALAINDLITSNNYILIAKNDILKQRVSDFNTRILNTNETEINICNYVSEFRNSVCPDVDISHMQYFLQLHQDPTFINADLLGPQKFGVLSIQPNRKNIESRHIKSLMDQYDFKENEDYFTREDVLSGKIKRTVYVISPYVLKVCLVGSKLLGKHFRKYYFFLELAIHAYSNYQSMYVLENRKSVIERLEASNIRLEEGNKRIESKLDIAIDNLDTLTDLHNEVNITENIVTPPSDAQLHTQFGIMRTNAPEAVLYDNGYHPCRVYTVYRTQKTRLDREEKKLCVRKATHTCIIKIDVHSSMYAWQNIKKDATVNPLIRLVGTNTFVLKAGMVVQSPTLLLCSLTSLKKITSML